MPSKTSKASKKKPIAVLPGIPAVASIDEFLDVVGRDQYGCFWG
jgi:hypothetical protein